mmetsp:Transcript_34539/g.83550  ORF Transcript_34539/g.83550 Transcript_34539/m.83550 type:complete len:326 (-) Transcript_34539:40-1017(-)
MSKGTRGPPLTAGRRLSQYVANLQVQIASDLHLEFYDALPPLEEILVPKAPVLALLGDICVVGSKDKLSLYEAFLTNCAERWKTVIVLAGNHEYYSNAKDRCPITEVDETIYDICARIKGNVRYLQNESCVINNVRVFGATLWTDIPKEQTVDYAQSPYCVEYKLNDFRMCYVKNPEFEVEGKDGKDGKKEKAVRALTVADTNARHSESVECILAAAGKARDQKENLLVLTHHSPTFRNGSNKEGQGHEYLKYAASSDLEHVFVGVHTWCHGHTHDNGDKLIRGTRVVSNQRGYKWEVSKDFSHSCVIEVPSLRLPDRSARCSIL